MGCTEKGVVWQMGTFETVPIHLATPPDTYPPIYSAAGQLRVGAAALVGAIAGAVGGATWVASQRFQSSTEAGVERVAADRAHAEKAESDSRKPSRRKRTNVAITRRELITGIAKAGVPAAVAVTVGTDALQAGETIPVPSAAVGLLYDASICIGCKACVAACAEANDTPPDTRRDATAPGAYGSERSYPQRHQALQAGRRLGLLVRETPVHALPRSGVRRRLSLPGAVQG